MQASLIRSFPSVFSQQESEEILLTEPLSSPEPTIGGYDEYTIKLNSEYQNKIELCVKAYLKSLDIDFGYIYRCSRLANITDAIKKHSDSVVRLEPKYHIRDFLVISYLTNFEAGEIIFPQHGQVFKPKIGDTLIFPSGPFFQHMVNPAIGKRVIMRSEYYLNLDSIGVEVDRTHWR